MARCRLSSTPVSGSTFVSISGGKIYGFISPGGAGGFSEGDSTAKLVISGGDFSWCSGIGEIKGGFGNHRPGTSVLDYSRCGRETAETIRNAVSRFTEIVAPQFEEDEIDIDIDDEPFEPDAPPRRPGEKEDPERPLLPSAFAFILFTCGTALLAGIGYFFTQKKKKK